MIPKMPNRRDFLKSSVGLTSAILIPYELKDEIIESLSSHTSANSITGIGEARISTGFIDFDKMTGGLQPSDLIIVAGRQFMGTTAFCLNIATHAGIIENKKVAIFSLDLPKQEIVTRMLSSTARVNYFKIKTGYLSKYDLPDLTWTAGLLSASSIFLDDTPAQSLLDIRAKSKKLQAEKGLDLIIIDYIPLMRSGGRTENRLSPVQNDINNLMTQIMSPKEMTENRQQEISEITRSLKAIAKELKVPVVVASHLSKALDDRFDKRPRFSDLKELGAMQDADKFILIYRKEFYEDNIAPENRGTTELVIGSNRNESPDTFELSFSQLSFLPEYLRFDNKSAL